MQNISSNWAVKIMARSVEAIVEGSVLKWARLSIGLKAGEAAASLRVDENVLLDWESNRAKPTVAKLRKIANLYKRPLIVFYAPEPPDLHHKAILNDFRSPLDHSYEEYSSNLMLEIRIANERRHQVLSLSDELGETPEEFLVTASLEEDAEDVALRIREALNVTVAQQREWKNPSEALREWKKAFEEAGVLVFQTGQFNNSVDISEMKGASISHQIYPIVLINSKDPFPNSKIFTIFHELAHIALNNVGLCDLRYYSKPNIGFQKIEYYCNHVAGAALMPRAFLLNDPTVIEEMGTGEWSTSAITRLSNRYSVSKQAVLLRLLTLKLTTIDFYQIKIKELYDGIQNRERSNSGPVPYHYRVINWHGNSLISKAFTAFYEEKISLNSLLGHLGVKIKHVPKIEERVMGFSSNLGS